MSLDLAGCDLRKKSFRDSNLEGAILHDADLRGVDLSGANLRGADLRGARTGMRRGWAAFVVPIALAVSICAGVAAGYAGKLLHESIRSDDPGMRAMGIFVAVSLVAFFLTTAIAGVRTAVKVVLPIEASVIVIAGAIAIATGAGTGKAALVGVAFLLVAALTVVLATLSRAVAGGANALLFMLVAMSGALTGALLGGGLTATAIAITTLVAGKRTIRGAKGYPWLEQISSRIAAHGGTNFRGADLTCAALDRAKLSATDFRGAQLAGTEWEGAKRSLCLFDAEPPPIPRRERQGWAARMTARHSSI